MKTIIFGWYDFDNFFLSFCSVEFCTLFAFDSKPLAQCLQ